MNARNLHTVGIIGLGLIGTSLGMALKRSNPDLVVKGLTRSETNARDAIKKRAIDVRTSSLSELLDNTDLVVLAEPVGIIIARIRDIGICAKRPVCITDTGSTKTEILRAARILPPHVSFIGGHPLAGREVSGAAHADESLFTKRPWILTPTRKSKKSDLTTLRALIQGLGAVPMELSAATHDRMLSRVSHLPFVTSCMLMETAVAGRGWQETLRLAGAGFRDTTRLSGGSPVMHADILRTNRAAIIHDITRLETALHRLKHDMASGQWEDIRRRLSAIQTHHSQWERSIT